MQRQLAPRTKLFLLSLAVSVGLYLLRGFQILAVLPGWLFIFSFAFTCVLGLLALQRPRHWS
ncbi:MAG: hypothetical protein AAGF24_02820 [Cyanobacteria bacterium P01_H01_bin.121]